MSTHKYLITVGKISRWETVNGEQQLVTRIPGDIVELTMEQAQDRQDSVRLATPADNSSATTTSVPAEQHAPPQTQAAPAAAEAEAKPKARSSARKSTRGSRK